MFSWCPLLFDNACLSVARPMHAMLMSFSLQMLVGFLQHTLMDFGYIPFNVPSTVKLHDTTYNNLQLVARHSGRMVFTAVCAGVPGVAPGQTVVIKLAEEKLITREVRDADLHAVCTVWLFVQCLISYNCSLTSMNVLAAGQCLCFCVAAVSALIPQCSLYAM